MTTRAVFALIAAVLVVSRLCHSQVLWAEEGLPLAAALQIISGKFLYSEIWFDKPPLTTAVYILWGAHTGWLLRLAGALYAFLACLLAYLLARDLWGAREGRIAAALLAFFLTFGIQSAIIPLAADLLMLVPHLAAVWFAWQRRALWSGLAAGVAVLTNAKAAFVILFCGILLYRYLVRFSLGVLIPNAAVLLWLQQAGALDDYILQVWELGRLYSAHTFVTEPWKEGVIRTLNWAGFHAALILPAAWFWRKEAGSQRLLFALWAVLSLAGVFTGWRFFPRYYFQLLPVFTLAAARGITGMGWMRWLAVLALAIPFFRFAPSYVTLGASALAGQPSGWRDVALDRDSQDAARILKREAAPGDTLFVWGFRPAIYAYTRMPAASRFLESQPLTGVLADRHLSRTDALSAGWIQTNRRELTKSRPNFIVDGLGLYNPGLAITRFRDLDLWLSNYKIAGRTKGSLVYQREPDFKIGGVLRPRLFQQRAPGAQ
ncbi:MAG: glycosyltransferase family 39 protein [Bryobacteraceae bacterium]|nr:hypothetical protein [Bryobacterales bacterium]MEB2364075.1 hypothetical protein [Bryobacterales bacterium]NUN02247.1 glycosyltransferase family 39 protein [Bryobacteraceae bacterium]